ncbi:MAG: sugar O-acetyltransferase [Gammaproteobacteria bacterium]|nr:sugar O-acetyltransferase [Gammaproteobacteria bacterium]
MTEFEKMINNILYDPMDSELVELRTKAHRLSKEYSDTFDDEFDKRREILKKLLPHAQDDTNIEGPIYFDYGVNTYIGKRFFANFNFTVLDCAKVIIGDDVFIAPNVSIYTAYHPLKYKERNGYMKNGIITDDEYAKEIVIGNNVWIGGSVTILPGVHIADGCVIGAGSVVTKDTEANSVYAGNPAKLLRRIDND